MSKVAARGKKDPSRQEETEEKILKPLAPPERHVARGASATEIRKAYGITEEQMDLVRRELKAFGLL